jgi:hypothetical protein
MHYQIIKKGRTTIGEECRKKMSVLADTNADLGIREYSFYIRYIIYENNIGGVIPGKSYRESMKYIEQIMMEVKKKIYVVMNRAHRRTAINQCLD